MKLYKVRVVATVPTWEYGGPQTLTVEVKAASFEDALQKGVADTELFWRRNNMEYHIDSANVVAESNEV